MDGKYKQVAVMGEQLGDDYAANRAVAEAIEKKWFKLASRTQVNCNRVMGLKDFDGWLSDFVSDRGVPRERLLRTVEQAYEAKGRRKKIVVKGPLVLKALKKLETQ